MKLSITLHDKTYTVDSNDEHQTIGEVVEQFKGLLVAAGFHPANVDEYFNTDGSWCINEPQQSHPFLLNRTEILSSNDELPY